MLSTESESVKRSRKISRIVEKVLGTRASARACDVKEIQVSHLHDIVFHGVKSRKVAIVMAGGPASGKSTVLDAFLTSLQRDRSEFAIIDPDLMLTSLQAFKDLSEQDALHALARTASKSRNSKSKTTTKHVYSATQDCFSTAALLNDTNLQFALENELNIVFDGTGQNFPLISQTLMKEQLFDAGYKVYMCIVTLDIPTALERAKIRELRTKRVVPESVIREIHTKVLKNIPKYKALGFIHQLVVYDNTTETPVRVYDSLAKSSR